MAQSKRGSGSSREYEILKVGIESRKALEAGPSEEELGRGFGVKLGNSSSSMSKEG